ncbi:hypothetical protein MAR_006254 [Mya arenaria]|uniref:Uncharacterized protein n=1 Tax=Mya arenaria TaxID=6604 RepID=A0ABY7DBI2_MYAAR|nr:hypothetical protein MAR_006210 [Mya arenaria]WAQ93783.1 hypothetical protein MAR_006254 [Mya arenaria]
MKPLILTGKGTNCMINPAKGLEEGNVLNIGEHKVVLGNKFCISVSGDYWAPACYCVTMNWTEFILKLHGGECIKDPKW